MRRLRRAHLKYIREQAKRRKKFKTRAIAAGTAAAITLGAGVCLNKALAAYTPDLHELPVSQDADADPPRSDKGLLLRLYQSFLFYEVCLTMTSADVILERFI